MPGTPDSPSSDRKSWLDRALSPFTDVRAGEGETAVLMLANIFVLLVCYSVIKTVREPLILLGGGAEVRSYAAAGQALLLMGFVPLYGWFASRVDRVRLILGVSLFFIVCIEIFASAVAARMPYVGVAFFVWVGILNVSLVAQFWSFASDLYKQEAGERLFPIIMIGMTAGAPVGSFVAARLFRSGITPQAILQIAAVLLTLSMVLYVSIHRREATRTAPPVRPLSAAGGFALVLNSRYLRLIALLVVLLNVVNTTGEYLLAKRLTNHVTEMALVDSSLDKQAYIGAFSGDYQFWVNVTALVLQAFVTSRLVKYKGLRGALLALPLVAFGGYTLVAAGVGFSVVRWIKTAENATDYSIMNTARQMLWLPTTREEKYKAKQAIDTFFVRGGDVLSAAAVYLGTSVFHLSGDEFPIANIVLTVIWLGVALLILNPTRTWSRMAFRPVAAAATLVAVLGVASRASAQETVPPSGTREAHLAAQRASKATELRPYESNPLERKIELIDRTLFRPRSIYPFMGSTFEGGGLAVGPGYRTRFGDSGTFNAHATWSIRNQKEADAAFALPAFADSRVTVTLHGNWLDAPNTASFGVGNTSSQTDRDSVRYRARTMGVATRVRVARFFAVGSGIDAIGVDARPGAGSIPAVGINPTYRTSRAFAEFDWRTSPGYSTSGGFYRLDWSDYRQTNGRTSGFRRVDAEVQQFVPFLRDNWVFAMRALASTTESTDRQAVPDVLMPALGGRDVLRGSSSWRFRDRNRLLLTGEYRWSAGPLVDVALFVDAGTVAARPADLNLQQLHTSQGVGLRIHTPNATIARIELARSREGLSIGLSFSPSF